MAFSDNNCRFTVFREMHKSPLHGNNTLVADACKIVPGCAMKKKFRRFLWQQAKVNRD